MSVFMSVFFTVIPAVGFLVGAVMARGYIMQAREQKKVKRTEFVSNLSRIMNRCQHTSVPWPVMSVAGDLVAWLCTECNEERQEFKCPPIRYRVVCEHPNTTEIRTWGAGIVEHRCSDCGQRQMLTEEFEAALSRKELGPVPFIPILYSHEGE